jgi:hypothetical protein
MTTKIEGGTVIGFDGETHRIIQDGVVVFDEEQIIHVGKSYQGRVDETVDATPTTSPWTSLSTPTTSTQASGCTSPEKAPPESPEQWRNPPRSRNYHW